MIYDTFPFFNELELLELRLQELDPVVDRFVLAEAPRTHSNQPKPLYFHENRERFQKYLPKITHIVVDDLPDTADAWLLEGLQRRAVDRGLRDCRPDDIILHSDADEIPDPRVVARLAQTMRFDRGVLASCFHGVIRHPAALSAFRAWYKKRHPFVWLLEQRQFYYFLNCTSLSHPVWLGTRATFFRDYTSAFDLRRWSGHRVPNAGWHFSYMGGAERVRQKLASFAHQEFNRPEFTDLKHLEAALSSGRWALGDEHKLKFVPVDESFPAGIRTAQERFRDWIRQ